jgi:uncharacterized membrane protein YcfT
MPLPSITYLLSSLDMIVYLSLAYNLSINMGEIYVGLSFLAASFSHSINTYVQHKKGMNV